MSPRPKKLQLAVPLQDAILATAWELVAESGAPALSLRAIARALGITAPAIYHYYPDRDALVTALIVDAFTSLGRAQQDCIQDLPPNDLQGRLTALGLGYRDWALKYPQRYQMIFGTPIPGYKAPEEITYPVAARSLSPLMTTLQALSEAGKLRRDTRPPLTPELRGMLSSWSQAVERAGIEALYATLAIWSRVHGLVSLEIGKQIPTWLSDAGEVYRREIASIQMQYLSTSD